MGMLHRFFESLFFQTDAREYWKSAHYGLASDAFRAKAEDGTELDGIVLQPKGLKEGEAPRGTILFCHAAQFNREFNLPQVVFLALSGFRVVLFDYRGCGLSTGARTEIDALGTNARAVLDWLDASPYAARKVILFGQGVGADAALQLYDAAPERIAGLILESAYDRRSRWAKDRWGPVLGDFAAHCLSGFTAPEPADVLARIKVPALLIYPEKDAFVRKAGRERMAAALPAGDPAWTVPGAKYLGIFAGPLGPWHKAMIKWIEKTLAKSKR